ncbi:MAG: enolase C-terminal domain-like protein [Acidobacteriota bacterium]
MKITGIEVFPIRAPRREAVRAGNLHSALTASEFGILRIETDAGLEGLGEISITSPRVGFSLCHAARTLVAPELIGMDPLELPSVLNRVDRVLKGELSSAYIRAAFEMALWDLLGRSARIPVYQLLGGKAREAVPLAWGIYQKSPEEMAEDALKGLENGFQAIKLKVGRELKEDVAAVRAVSRAIGPHLPLRLDANMSWHSVPEASAAIRALSAEARVAWVEQPLEKHNLAGLRLLRQQSPVPIMADESLQTLRDAYAVALAEAADVFNVYVCEAGGILAASHIFALAAALDIPCIIGSQAELGIGTAAAAHLGVTVADLPYACETFGPLRYLKDIVVNGPRIERGFLYPPDGPGLGVELDWKTLHAWLVKE